MINLISKPDVYEDDLEGDGHRFYTDGPKIHQYLQELNENTFGKYDDVVTVGENVFYHIGKQYPLFQPGI